MQHALYFDKYSDRSRLYRIIHFLDSIERGRLRFDTRSKSVDDIDAMLDEAAGLGWTASRSPYQTEVRIASKGGSSGDSGWGRDPFANWNADASPKPQNHIEEVKIIGGLSGLGESMRAKAKALLEAKSGVGVDKPERRTDSPTTAQKKGRRNIAEEANRKALLLLVEDPGFADKNTKQWSDILGCSVGTVNRLEAWRKKELIKQRHSLNAQSLPSESMLQGNAFTPDEFAMKNEDERKPWTQPEREAELKRLVEEQAKDDAAERKQKPAHKRV